MISDFFTALQRNVQLLLRRTLVRLYILQQKIEY